LQDLLECSLQALASFFQRTLLNAATGQFLDNAVHQPPTCSKTLVCRFSIGIILAPHTDDVQRPSNK
jgi:hypothetical protein